MTATEPAGLPKEIGDRIAAGAFLLVDKPRGPSSHQVTAWVRDILFVPKAGHAGTLDPNVSGLLWVGVGPALKLLPLLLEFPKRYVAVATLHGSSSRKELERVMNEFVGPIYQTPPVRSAVRRERRVRTIHRLSLLDYDAPNFLFDVVADSGTYVRTLAVDLGEALGVGAHMEELRRIGTGPFKEGASVSLTTLSDAAKRAVAGDPSALAALLHPMEEVWKEFPSVVLKESAVSAVAHGADLAAAGIHSLPRPFARAASVALVSRRGELIALGRSMYDSEEIPKIKHGWVVDAQRVLVDSERYPATWRTASAPKATGAPG
ncbi:MAG: RNA-guided pseudouridylation complex pseudouridine synthase subunit Cbf5 [Thermoplasmata archaeon]|nr:RNA-guided pseudouridylation complex pseudouridine synthase subunit Cbf5 [Thermoplasmata archaeon]